MNFLSQRYDLIRDTTLSNGRHNNQWALGGSRYWFESNTADMGSCKREICDWWYWKGMGIWEQPIWLYPCSLSRLVDQKFPEVIAPVLWVGPNLLQNSEGVANRWSWPGMWSLVVGLSSRTGICRLDLTTTQPKSQVSVNTTISLFLLLRRKAIHVDRVPTLNIGSLRPVSWILRFKDILCLSELGPKINT